MAYVSVADWKPEQVTEWVKGLDNCLLPYLHGFSNNEINGLNLLNLTPEDLEHLGVFKIGHQEIILEGVERLQNFHYELDRENLQVLALRLASAARSLFGRIRDQGENTSVNTYVMADVADVIDQVKSLVSWLDRAPFSCHLELSNFKPQLLTLSLKMGLSAQRDRFAENPIPTIRECAVRLSEIGDYVIQDATDPMILQPAYLDLATIKKRSGEDLGFFLEPSFHGDHQIGEMKLSSAAHQSGKIQAGDEIVQVNYQTVVGWSRKKVLALIEESPNDLLLTLKRRPRHVNMYGQMYMKPYRLPSRKRATAHSRWNDSVPNTRPEFLTIPQLDIPINAGKNKQPPTDQQEQQSDKEKSAEDKVKLAQAVVSSTSSSSSDEEFVLPHSTSPTSMRLYLPKPRAPIQRRFTLSGPPRPSAQSEHFWRRLQLERCWRSNQNNSNNVEGDKDGMLNSALRGKTLSEGASVAVKKLDTSAASDARTIIHLNKVKRDAFFSDMGHTSSKPSPPRGRLDKSRSTPAYDLGEPEPPQPSPRRHIPVKPEALPRTSIIVPPASQPQVSTVPNECEHGRMVNTINQTLHQDQDDDGFFSEIPPAPREIRPVAAQRKYTLPPTPLPPKPKFPPQLPPRPPPTPPPTKPAHSPSLPKLTPSPTPSHSSSLSSEKERSKNTLDHLKAMWTLGKGGTSPRSTRKPSNTLSRRREVSVKDIGPCHMSGILWHRKRRTPATWTQAFFVLQGPAFYGFRHKDRQRADLFIYLPGFTCAIAEEVKSRSNAFKIYHTGTVFYFAAESEEQMNEWMTNIVRNESCSSTDSLKFFPKSTFVATPSMEVAGASSPGWSATDSESDSENEPKMSRLLSGLSGLATTPRTHHSSSSSSAVDSSKNEDTKSGQSKKSPGSETSLKSIGDVASLDRKYLKLLIHKAAPLPVPTSQFRSYRRMQPTPAARPPIPSPDSLEPGRLSRRSLHSSNPSLVHRDMADYRMTQERLREFRNLRNEGRPEDRQTGIFMTLEQFMLSRQEEQRNLRSNRRVYPSSSRGNDGGRRESAGDIPQLPARKNLMRPASSSHQLHDVETRGPEEPQLGTPVLPDYPGIEYPPAFEPETYTLQYMLNDRRRRDAKHK